MDRRSRPSRRVVLGVAAWVVAGAAGVGAVELGSGRKHPAASKTAQVQTVAVTRTDLSDSQTLAGTLGFGASQTVKGTKPGMVTWLPAPAATVSRGQPLLRVDNQAVDLFYGSTPLYRSLDAVGLVGPDVKVVADNLTALGYSIGHQPPVGTSVTQPAPAAAPPPATGQASGGTAKDASFQVTRVTATPTATATATPSASTASTATTATTKAPTTTTPPSTPEASTPEASTPAPPQSVEVAPGDGVLTAPLVAAIKRWQLTLGGTPNGVLDPGDVIVLPSAVRVGTVDAQLGDDAQEPLMEVTTTAKVVVVPVDSTSVGTIKEGDAVTITLPDSSTTAGRVADISSTAQAASTGDSGAPPQQNVTVTFDDTSVVRSLDSASVQVQFTGQTEKGVLAVPVGALLALSGGGYALQLKSGGLVAVRTGMYAMGMVAVTGRGIVPGVQVVTSS
jgi:hypothetical protein